MNYRHNKTRTIQMVGYEFDVYMEPDHDFGPPYENSDCHGPVRTSSTSTYQSSYCPMKRPGERLLYASRNYFVLYDFQEACRIARTVWGCKTRREAAEAAQQDFDFLKAYYDDEWGYHTIEVRMRMADADEDEDEDDMPPLAEENIGGVEYWHFCAEKNSHIDEIIQELVQECLHSYAETVAKAELQS